MKSKLVWNRNEHSAWLKLLIIVVLGLGILFRFVNIDKKIYWRDEAFTSLRISGNTKTELVEKIYDGHIIGIPDLQKYQYLDHEKSVINTIYGLAVEEPQLPPLYFVMVRFWVEHFGNSVTIIRSFSAIISLFVFPCIYWLCLELFDLRLTGWVAIALIAVSPFHILYAQEARPYSLWTVSILLSSAALLRALRLQTRLSWSMYAIAGIWALYTFLLSALMLIGYGVYVFIIERFQFTKRVISYLLASLVTLVTIAPWILVVVTNFSQAESRTSWSSQKFSLLSLLMMWVGNISRIFVDFGVGSDDHLNKEKLILLIPTILILLALVGYAIYFICSHTPKQAWLFIVTLIGFTAISLIIPDLIFGGRRSGVARYLIPCYLGIQLTVAYLFSSKVASIDVNTRWQKLWQVVMIILISSGVLSCVVSSQSTVWWNKDSNYYIPVAQIINQTSSPLVISDSEPEYLLSLSYLLDSKVQFQLVVIPKVPIISNNFSNLFLYRPTKKLRQVLEEEQNYNITPVSELTMFQSKLWRLEKIK